MHVPRLPRKLVTQSQPAAVQDMSTLWNFASRLRLCHVPVRLRQATTSLDVSPRSTPGQRFNYRLVGSAHRRYCV